MKGMIIKMNIKNNDEHNMLKKSTQKHIFIVRYKDNIETYEFDIGQHRLIVGRDEKQCDLVILSEVVSRRHMEIIIKGSKCYVMDLGSTNHTYKNKKCIGKESLTELNLGDQLYIDNNTLTSNKGVIIEYHNRSANESENSYYLHSEKKSVVFGRDTICDIVGTHPMLSRQHFKIKSTERGWVLEDLKSTNGTFLNGNKVTSRILLNNHDEIFAANTRFVFLKKGNFYQLDYYSIKKGISIDSLGLIKKGIDKDQKQEKVFINDVSLSIKPCEFVAIVGGSGAGKSTLMDCLNNFRPANEGKVYINGKNLYSNYDVYKSIMGYVQQKDVLYDKLTVKELLTYAAQLRMPDDVMKKEINNRVVQVIKDVGLDEHANKLIEKLSGGQKKRVSIAIELISEPKLLFLDEPTSGLDPGMDKGMMELLKNLAHKGTTIILITHATSNIYLCDKVVFLGKGGKLCFFGKPSELLSFFDEEDIAGIYIKLSTGSKADTTTDKYKEKLKKSDTYKQMLQNIKSNKDNLTNNVINNKNQINGTKQYFTLIHRYFKLLMADKISRNIILLQAPIMFVILMLVNKSDSFGTYEGAKQILFTISCMTALMGILNSFLEICKEREILVREHRANLKLMPYLMSKMTVLSVVGIVQGSFLAIAAALSMDLPKKHLLFNSIGEFTITLCLSISAATAMGLLISAAASTTERATLIMPAAIVLQLVLSGVLFKLTAATKLLSNLIVSKWTMSALGSIFALNKLPLKIYEKAPELKLQPRELEHMYDFTKKSLFSAWLGLIIFALLSLIFSFYILRYNINKNER
ncbi:MAG: FHA domain-containing protein [Halanaerobiales bacterium]